MANIVIIGGGVAGLSAGIHLAIKGHSTVICEKHNIAGGNLTGWQRGEYHIDNCIHWLTGTNPYSPEYKIWHTLGALGETHVHQPESLYTVEEGGATLSLYYDIERLESEMLAISPEDAKRTKKLMAAVRHLQLLSCVGGPDFDRTADLLGVIKAIPSLIKYFRLSVKDLAEKFKHPLLKKFLRSFWGDDFGALALLIVFSTFTSGNGGLPEGGSLKMAERMAERYKALGGDLRTGCEVAKIERHGAHARTAILSDGSAIDADYFILTTDPVHAFSELLDFPMPKDLRKLYKNKKNHRFSSHQCAIAFEGTELPFSGDMLIDIPEKYRPILRSDVFTLREFSHEPSFAPEGEIILGTMTFCLEDDAVAFINEKSDDPSHYRQHKKHIAEVTVRIIEQKYPEMKGRLKVIDVWTPATYKRYTGADIGSYMSFILPKGRLPIPKPPRVKGLANVYFASQWQLSPGGLPIAAARGKAAASAITKRELAKSRKLPRKQVAK